MSSYVQGRILFLKLKWAAVLSIAGLPRSLSYAHNKINDQTDSVFVEGVIF